MSLTLPEIRKKLLPLPQQDGYVSLSSFVGDLEALWEFPITHFEAQDERHIAGIVMRRYTRGLLTRFGLGHLITMTMSTSASSSSGGVCGSVETSHPALWYAERRSIVSISSMAVVDDLRHCSARDGFGSFYASVGTELPTKLMPTVFYGEGGTGGDTQTPHPLRTIPSRDARVHHPACIDYQSSMSMSMSTNTMMTMTMTMTDHDHHHHEEDELHHNDELYSLYALETCVTLLFNTDSDLWSPRERLSVLWVLLQQAAASDLYRELIAKKYALATNNIRAVTSGGLGGIAGGTGIVVPSSNTPLPSNNNTTAMTMTMMNTGNVCLYMRC